MSNPIPRATLELCADSIALANELQTTLPDTVVTYDRLSQVIGGNDVRKPRFRSLLHATRQRLVKKGVLFAAVRGQGLKRLSDSGIAATGPGRVRKVHRTAKRETRNLLAADQAKLTNAERIIHNAALSIVGTIAEVTRPRTVKAIEKRLTQSPAVLSLEATLEAFKPRPTD